MILSFPSSSQEYKAKTGAVVPVLSWVELHFLAKSLILKGQIAKNQYKLIAIP